jgi:hypothetical protein
MSDFTPSLGQLVKDIVDLYYYFIPSLLSKANG